MNRIVLGVLATLLFVFASLFWLQGRAQEEEGLPPPKAEAVADKLPCADVAGSEAGLHPRRWS